MTTQMICRIDTIKPLGTLLQCLFKRLAQCLVTNEGIVFVLRDQNCLQMNAYYKSSSAQEFIQTSDVEFHIDVQLLKQCITMFGSDESQVRCELELKEDGLFIKMEESDMETECQLSLFDSQPLFDLQESFFEYRTITKLILSSEIMKTAFQELDDTCEVVQFRVSLSSPNLEISAVGLAGESKIQLSNTIGVMDSFYCEMECSFQYSFKMIQSSFKALTLSQKVNIRMNEDGLLCLQVP